MNRLTWISIVLGIVFTTNIQAVSMESNNIDLQAPSATAAGFTPDEQLISLTNTLSGTYSNAMDVALFSNNNHCEASNDVPSGYYDESGTRELHALWLTWDTNYLYIAVQADVHGSLNDIVALIDIEPSGGITNFSGNLPLGSQIEERRLTTTGFSPDIIARLWCAQNSDFFDGSSYAGGAEIKWHVAGIWSNKNMKEIEDKFYSWYNGSAKLVMMKISQDLLLSPALNRTNKYIKLAILSAGTFYIDSEPVYDTIPQGSSGISSGAELYHLDNFFTIQLTDGSGNIMTGISPKSAASVNFYPGSRKQAHLNTPQLLSPANGETAVTNAPTFRWSSAAQNIKQLITYRLTLSTNPDLSSPTTFTVSHSAGKPSLYIAFIICILLPFSRLKKIRVLLLIMILLSGAFCCSDDDTSADPLAEQQYSLSGLQPGTTYYWKVLATDNDGYYIESDIASFTTE